MYNKRINLRTTNADGTAATFDVFAIAESGDTIPATGTYISTLPDANASCAPGSVIIKPATGEAWIADETAFQPQQ